MTTQARSIVGQTYGRLTVVERSPRTNGTYWRCQCICGKERVVRGDALKYGTIASCGCLRNEFERTPESFPMANQALSMLHEVWR